MPAKPAQFPSSEIIRWSEPVIADCIYSAYERCFGGQTEISEALARCHCRLWRNLLNAEPVVARYLRRELVKAASDQRMSSAAVDAIDAAVFSHLLEVLMRPGQRPRDVAREDGMLLVHAASTLGEIRKVA
ncbi:MAG: hypothetical protein WB816_10240 [Methylocystis sp.]